MPLQICLGERKDDEVVLRYSRDGKKDYVVIPKDVWIELIDFIKDVAFPQNL